MKIIVFILLALILSSPKHESLNSEDEGLVAAGSYVRGLPMTFEMSDSVYGLRFSYIALLVDVFVWYLLSCVIVSA
ncbi:MAG: hypothetical protein JW778_04055 [Candidatus Altiarchaeota archaeon]|nr:hypothetical protein [Candidatus Altiarchaeota archaeon]